MEERKERETEKKKKIMENRGVLIKLLFIMRSNFSSFSLLVSSFSSYTEYRFEK
jgi:hypothetical protein